MWDGIEGCVWGGWAEAAAFPSYYAGLLAVVALTDAALMVSLFLSEL